jgi:hypothetical protein
MPSSAASFDSKFKRHNNALWITIKKKKVKRFLLELKLGTVIVPYDMSARSTSGLVQA